MTTRVSNSKYLAVLDPIPQENLGWYCRVLSERDYASQIALVERFVHLGFTKEETGAGGAKITLDADDRLFSDPLPAGESVKLQDQEALWQIIEDGIVRAEFLAEDLAEGKITEDGKRTVEITGRGPGAVLDWRKVPPYGMPNPTTMQLKWELRSPMSVWVELFNEAQQDGFIPFVSLTFDLFNDSAGEPWGADQDVTVQAGDSLLDLLTRWCEAGGYAWKMLPGFRLQVLKNPGTIRTGEVVFTMYKDQSKHERKLTRREIANVVYAASGDNGIAFAVDTASQARWHKRAAWASAGDSPDPSGRSAVANSLLGMKKDPSESRSITVDPMGAGRRVFVDYDVSDRVTVEIDGDDSGQSERKIVAISLDLDADSTVPSLELTLQSKMEARSIKQQKQLDALGASKSDGAGSSIPVSQVISATKLEDLANIDVAGIQQGDVLTWNEAAGKWVDGTPNLTFLSDVDTAGVAAGQALIYDGTSGLWKPGSATYSVAWTDVTGKPTTFPPSSHSHVAADISDSTTVGRSVLKAADAATARSAIGAGTGNSNLVLGTTSTTAKAGNYVPAWTEITSKPSTFEPVVKGIDWLSDVDTASTAPADGQALVWNAASGLWKPATISGGSGGGATTLDALTDVVTSGANAPSNGQALVWDSNAGQWKPGTVSSSGGSGGSSSSSTVDTVLGTVKYGNGSTTVVTTTGGPMFGPASAYPDLTFTLAATTKVELLLNVYLLPSTSTDYCIAISNDNWTTTYLLDAYSTAASQPPVNWRIQYGRGRVAATGNYQSLDLPRAYLNLPAGSYAVRLYKLTSTGSWTAAENGGYAAAFALTSPGGSGGYQQIVSEPGTSIAAWVPAQGTWSSNGTEIVSGSTATSRAFFNARLPLAAPVIIDWEMRLDSAGGTGTDRHGGLLIGHDATATTSAAAARFIWDGASGYNMQIEQDGVSGRLSRAWAGVLPDEWHRYRVAWNGYDVTLWVDGIMVGTAGGQVSAKNVPSYIGLKSNGTPVRFRNLKVWQVAPPATPDFPAVAGGRTAVVNYPPNLNQATTTTATTWRGTAFTATASSTITDLRARVNAVSGRAYVLGIYEVNASDRTTITAIVTEQTVTASAAGDLTLTASGLNVQLVMGRSYVVGVGSAAGVTHYYVAVGLLPDSPVTTTVYSGSVDPGRYLGAMPAVGSVMSKGSDYFSVGMTVAF